ncbi:IPT/TIG domain-containing protein [Asanoa iriomotensis]|uniref:IPT/TIG domain-containing protein n=1 Tax=Asanoa iriomotensis TaxID=234613 RepID=A0ABQ4C071_9ACTN|nr:IPT/TIG domain-containing protein [Asanoa iriomotensis]GIF56177.1 hypothetical protein Air01nite_22720 [Asanoa iriomotensis]
MRHLRRALLVLALTGLAGFGPPATGAAANEVANPNSTQTTVPAPILGIDSVTPESGSTPGGFVVTVTGVGFAPGQTTVRLCDIDIPPAGVQVNPAGNVLTFTAPPCAAGPTQLRVTTSEGSASVSYRYYAQGSLPVTGGPVWLPLTGIALGVTGGLALLLTRRRRV